MYCQYYNQWGLTIHTDRVRASAVRLLSYKYGLLMGLLKLISFHFCWFPESFNCHTIWLLSHWGQKNDQHFTDITSEFSWKKIFQFWLNLTEICSWESKWHQDNMDSGDGLDLWCQNGVQFQRCQQIKGSNTWHWINGNYVQTQQREDYPQTCEPGPGARYLGQRSSHYIPCIQFGSR